MDATRDLSQIGQENPRVPSSPDLADQLFDTVFDWPAYLNDTESSLDIPSHRATPHQLEKLITEIHPLIDSLESHRFFKMGTSFGGDDEAVTASEYSGHPSPPDLYRGEGSTSPSDHSGSIIPDGFEEAQPRTSNSLRDYRAHDDKWTYPQGPPFKGIVQGYPPLLRVTDARLQQYPEQTPGLKRRRSEKTVEKRPRQLADPMQTADVRRSGACLPCRVSKTRCHDSGVCPTCRKAFPDHSHMVCLRYNPSELWPVISKIPDIWSKNPSKETKFHSSPRFFIAKPREISIFFTRDPASPPLRAFVQAYRWNDEKDDGRLEKAAFPRDFVPSHHTLQMWAEDQIRYERGSDFPSAVHKFLLSYSQDGAGLPKHGLVTKVHKMACFFRIWRTSSFWCRDPSNKIVSLPMSVQAELRNIVLQGLHRIEYDILKELDEYVTPHGSPKPQDKMAIWASMWQLILIYRDMIAAFRNTLARSEQNPNDPQTAVVQSRYRMLTDFFPLIAIFYHYQFRTKKSLEVSLDWPKSAARPCQSKSIHRAAEKVLERRKSFLQHVQSSQDETDKLLGIFVVNHELKKLSARSRTSKSSSSKSKSSYVNDDCDG